MLIVVVASSPPTTSPKPVTTEASARIKQVWSDLNNTGHGNPSSFTKYYAEKGTSDFFKT